MRPNPQKTALLVTFTEEMLNGKLYFLYSVRFCLNLFFSRRNIARYLDFLFLLTLFRPFVKRLFWQETFQYKFKSPIAQQQYQTLIIHFLFLKGTSDLLLSSIFGTNYSRVDQVTFAEDSL